jgi:N-methylhydantoinase A/oxoprolinase/acetone carboxylase beta subunit
VTGRVGSDTGGTFTDLVTAAGVVVKVPSTPDDPGRAVRAGLDQLGLDQPGAEGLGRLAHGTTVGTNALLERRGATVGLVTSQGFADVIEIGRQDRPSLYDQTADRPVPLVTRRHRYEVAGRLDATGAELVPIDPDGLAPLDDEVEAVAVVLLHADLDPSHEVAVATELRARGHDVSVSHEISPEFREVERTFTTVINASLRSVCRAYLQGLSGLADQVLVMTSSGGLVPVEEAAERPVELLLSGPAGGVLAAAAAATANGWPDALTFDMGGTSTDVCLVLDGRPAPAAQRSVAGFEVRVPSLDVHTIGAGGGSIARLDAGGALRVGPDSAGAVPGPACYRRGGTEPTVTDANLALGRLAVGAELPGLGALDVEAARAAIAGARLRAEGIVAVVDAAMVQALRAVSVERGVDPRGLALVAFGGAGPLHACGLAEALGMPLVVVPARAGVLSAVGILAADEQRHRVATWLTPTDHRGLAQARRALGAEVATRLGGGVELGGDVEVETWVDCRYGGQSFELTVSSVDAFHDEHRRRNGYASPDRPVEVVAVRARARRRSPVALGDLEEPIRTGAVGPAVLAEPDCTIWVPDGWRADPGQAGALLLTRA